MKRRKQRRLSIITSLDLNEVNLVLAFLISIKQDGQQIKQCIAEKGWTNKGDWTDSRVCSPHANVRHNGTRETQGWIKNNYPKADS